MGLAASSLTTWVPEPSSGCAPAAVQDAAGQLAQLVAVEHLVGVALPGRVKEAPLLLKALYDEDLAEEDLVMAW